MAGLRGPRLPMPALQAGIEDGFPNPPEETEIELDNVRCTPQLMEIAQ